MVFPDLVIVAESTYQSYQRSPKSFDTSACRSTVILNSYLGLVGASWHDSWYFDEPYNGPAGHSMFERDAQFYADLGVGDYMFVMCASGLEFIFV
jgi:hypothetical protein